MSLGFVDVVHAYFHTKARRSVELSREDHDEGKRGLLKKAMYGMRGTAHN